MLLIICNSQQSLANEVKGHLIMLTFALCVYTCMVSTNFAVMFMLASVCVSFNLCSGTNMDRLSDALHLPAFSLLVMKGTISVYPASLLLCHFLVHSLEL